MRLQGIAENRRLQYIASLLQRYDISIAVHLFILGFGLICFSRMLLFFAPVALPENLYGNNIVTSLGCLMVAAAPVFYLSLFLRRRDVDWFSISIFILAAIVSLHYIHISNNMAPTPDLGGHLDRIRFISTHWLEPYGYNGWQKHHPPVYYYVAAFVLWWAKQIGTVPELTALRFLAWNFFLVFHAYNLLTIQKVPLSKTAHYIVVSLAMLWPMGLFAASQISNEPLYYAFYAAAFYYLVRWCEERHLRLLGIAITLALIAFTIRVGSVIPLCIIVLTVFVQILQGRFSIRSVSIKPTIILTLFAICCVVISSGKIIFNQNVSPALYMGIYPYGFKATVSHIVSFEYKYLINVPSVYAQKSYGTILLRSLIFNEYPWQNVPLMAMLNFLLVTLCAYMIPAAMTVKRSVLLSACPYVFGVLIPLIFHITFVVLNDNIYAGNGRYVYPITLCFSILYGMSYSYYKRRDYVLLSILGPVLAISFSLLSVYFFWNNAR